MIPTQAPREIEQETRAAWGVAVPKADGEWGASEGAAAIVRAMALDLALHEGKAGSCWAKSLNEALSAMAGVPEANGLDVFWNISHLRISEQPMARGETGEDTDIEPQKKTLGMLDFDQHIRGIALWEIRQLITAYEKIVGLGEGAGQMAARHLFADACVALGELPYLQVSGVSKKAGGWRHACLERISSTTMAG